MSLQQVRRCCSTSFLAGSYALTATGMFESSCRMQDLAVLGIIAAFESLPLPASIKGGAYRTHQLHSGHVGRGTRQPAWGKHGCMEPS